MATLKDIGDELGLSAATVSRALNGFPEVSERTRKMVQDMADRLNYRPNRIAQKLVTGRSGMVGMIVRINPDFSSEPIFFQMVMALSDALGARDVDLVLTVDRGDDPIAPYARMIEKNTLDGFILNAPQHNDPRVAHLRERDVPFVLHGKVAGSRDYPFYDVDNHKVAADAVSLLTDLGHTRIALINGDKSLAFTHQRGEGFLGELATRGISVPDQFIVHDQPGYEAAYTQTLAMLSGRFGLPPTALVCATTHLARDARRAISDRGLSVPDHISIVAHDDALPNVLAHDFDPPLTVTSAPLVDACEPLAAALLDLIEGAPVSDLQTEVPAKLIVRASTGPVPPGGEVPWA